MIDFGTNRYYQTNIVRTTVLAGTAIVSGSEFLPMRYDRADRSPGCRVRCANVGRLFNRSDSSRTKIRRREYSRDRLRHDLARSARRCYHRGAA